MFKKPIIFGSVSIVSFLSISLLFSQAPNISEQPATKTEVSTNKPKISIQDFNPISADDPRFTVSNYSLDRRYAPDGRGEILDVYFDITNNTSETLNFIGWVLAYNETDAVDREERSIIPYPTWRVENPDKRLFLNRFITVTPQNIDPNELWTKGDSDYNRHYYAIDRMRTAVGSMKPIGDVFPPAWKYVSYIHQHASKGLAFKVYGDQGPGQHELVQTNYVPPTAEENRTKIFKHIADHTYTLEHTRRKLIFRSHHYSPYRADFRFFNIVSIILFDAQKVADAEEQKGRELREGELPIQPMVYYRTVRSDHKLRIY